MMWTMLASLGRDTCSWLWGRRGVFVIVLGVAVGIAIATRLCFDGLKMAIPQSMESEMDIARAAYGMTRVMLCVPIGTSIGGLIVAWGFSMTGANNEH